MEDKNWDQDRKRIIGLGDASGRKSYYPELKEKVRELEELNNNLVMLFENSNDAIFIHDVDGVILKYNERAREQYGLEDGKEGEINFQDITVREKGTQIIDVWRKVIMGTPVILESKLYSADRSKIFNVEISLRKTNWYDNEAIICTIRDISQRKKYERRLKKAKLKAEESEKLKTAFLANMSHEIRTPLNGILGFTELLIDDNFDQVQKTEMGEIILNSGDLLLSIINDIIDISKIEAQQINLFYSEFKIEKLLIDLYKSFRLKAEKSNLELSYTKNETHDHIVVNSDYNRLKQIMSNLIGNALKYTDYGSVNFGIVCKGNDIEFFVKDTGIGIPKEKQLEVFERFNRREAFTKKVGGSGLGLAIAKNLIELLGGKIWVESKPKLGSCFYFTIPLNIDKS